MALKREDGFCHAAPATVRTLVFILASSLGLFTPLHARALVILLLAQVGEDAGLGTAALKTLQRIIQSFIFLHIDLRHEFPSPQNVINMGDVKGPNNLALTRVL